jgi:hypothetical protein
VKCIICHRLISAKARHFSALAPNGRGGTRRVYGCARCEAKFDAWLDQHAEPEAPVPPEVPPEPSEPLE